MKRNNSHNTNIDNDLEDLNDRSSSASDSPEAFTNSSGTSKLIGVLVKGLRTVIVSAASHASF